MKLSMSMLARALGKYDLELHILRDAVTIRGVRFLSDDRNKFALEYVYIGIYRIPDQLVNQNNWNLSVCEKL